VNLHPIAPGLRDTHGPRPSLSDFICHAGRRVPAAPLPTMDPRPAWQRPPRSGVRATWLGHSTVLLEVDGWRVLTDPVWGERASPLRAIGPKRFQPVPVALEHLPPLDAVLVSHDHYDHLDWPTVRQLARTPVPFITSLGVGAHLEHFGVASERITELDWWESHTLPGTGLRFTAAPSQHFSGRGLKDRNATLWSSFVLAGEHSRVFFSGDTGLTREYETVAQKLGPFDLVMLEVGAHHPSWGDIHLGPDNALQALHWLGGGAFLPVHWGSFSLALHDWDQPAERLLALAQAQGCACSCPAWARPSSRPPRPMCTPRKHPGGAGSKPSLVFPRPQRPLLQHAAGRRATGRPIEAVSPPVTAPDQRVGPVQQRANPDARRQAA
jgi:L-ascorbate metabolism protein UlaG (beta-lactamase superfamily)